MTDMVREAEIFVGGLVSKRGVAAAFLSATVQTRAGSTTC